MDKYTPTLVMHTNNSFCEMMDYVYQVSHPVHQQLLKLYGCLIADA